MNIELIAHIARAAARGEEVKLAFDFGSIGDSVGSIGDSVKGYWEGLSPEARSSIIGGVGGLGVGALGGGLLGGGKGALIGALAGGGLGALGGRTYDPLLSYFKKLTGQKENEKKTQLPRGVQYLGDLPAEGGPQAPSTLRASIA